LNGGNRADAHADGRELPVVRHQARVRIRRETGATLGFASEALHGLHRQPALEKRTRVDAGSGVALVVDLIARAIETSALEKVVEAHLVQGRAGGVRGEVPADTG